MRYILLIILLLILGFFSFYKFEGFRTNSDDIQSIYKCNDESLNPELKINNDGEFLSFTEAVNRATEINRLNMGDSYEGIYKNGNDYYFCKDVSNTSDVGNTFLLRNSVDGSILMKGNVGVKTNPINDFIVNNDGTLLVKDKFCMQKSNKQFVCLTSDDIYRIKNRPINIPREKELCLSKFNERTGIEESACVNKNHFKLLNGQAVTSLKHMDYSKPNYGNGYVKNGYVNNHGPHIHHKPTRWWGVQIPGMIKKTYPDQPYWDGHRWGDSMNFMQVIKNNNGKLFFGFDVNKPWGRTERVGTSVLKSTRG